MTHVEVEEILKGIEEHREEIIVEETSFMGATIRNDGGKLAITGTFFGDPRLILAALLECVKDVACGIEEDDLGEIFDAFNKRFDDEEKEVLH